MAMVVVTVVFTVIVVVLVVVLLVMVVFMGGLGRGISDFAVFKADNALS